MYIIFVEEIFSHAELIFMNLIFLGDVVGKGGRSAVLRLLPELKREFNAQFAVVNGENSASGAGLSASCVKELLSVAEVVTGGDHTWDQKEFPREINSLDRMVRPANFSLRHPGVGMKVFQHPGSGEVAVISLVGKVFMKESAYCPFETVEKLLSQIPSRVKTVVVDFHAEATSEKLAMGYFLDGKVTAVFGTHTHVQTADAKVLAGGTAYITDAGMCGADFSVLGRDVNAVLDKFTIGLPNRLPVVEKGLFRVDGAVVSYDHISGKALKITSFSRTVEI